MRYFDKTKLTKGGTYVDDHHSKALILKFDSLRLPNRDDGSGELMAHLIDMSGNYRPLSSCCTTTDDEKRFRHATSTESRWLEDCIKLNKTLTLDESINLHKHEEYDIF